MKRNVGKWWIQLKYRQGSERKVTNISEQVEKTIVAAQHKEGTKHRYQADTSKKIVDWIWEGKKKHEFDQIL